MVTERQRQAILAAIETFRANYPDAITCHQCYMAANSTPDKFLAEGDCQGFDAKGHPIPGTACVLVSEPSRGRIIKR